MQDTFSKSANGCCVNRLKESRVTFIGLLTLSLPLIYLAVILYIPVSVLKMLGIISTDTLTKLIKIKNANLNLLSSYEKLLFSRRIIFKKLHLNFFFFSFIWLMVMTVPVMIIKLLL